MQNAAFPWRPDMNLQSLTPTPCAELPALLRRPAHAVKARADIERILVPFDGSDGAWRALRHAMTLYRPEHLRIELLNVQPPLMAGDVTPLTPADAAQASRTMRGTDMLRPPAEALRERRVGHAAHVAVGDAAEEIAKTADRLGCTQIVMGTRAMGAVRSLLSRSVARRVVKLTPVPVTLLKGVAAQPGRAAPLHAIPLRGMRNTEITR